MNDQEIKIGKLKISVFCENGEPYAMNVYGSRKALEKIATLKNVCDAHGGCLQINVNGETYAETIESIKKATEV